MNRFLGRVLAIGVGFVTAALVSEAALRLAHRVPCQRNSLGGFHRVDADLGWVGVSDYRARHVRPEFDVLVELDAGGWRRPALPHGDGTSLPPGALVFLGDSFTWGWGVPQGELFTDHLQTEVGPARPVVNRGLVAYSTGQELILLKRDVLPSAPAGVVVMFFGNDPLECIDRRRGRRPAYELVEGELVAHPVEETRPIEQALRNARRHSRVLTRMGFGWDLVRERLDEHEVSAGPGLAPYPMTEPAWETCAALLARMAELCAAAEPPVPLHLAYIPTVYDLQHPALDDGASPVRPALARVCAEADIAYLDLTPAFAASWRGHGSGKGGEPLLYPLDQHWTTAGHRLAADLLHGAWFQ